MTERIKKLTELTLSGQMYADTVKTTYDEADLLLPRQQTESKRICEYILNQEPKLTEYSCMTGFFNFDGSVVGDAFRRGGHKATQEALFKSQKENDKRNPYTSLFHDQYNNTYTKTLEQIKQYIKCLKNIPEI